MNVLVADQDQGCAASVVRALRRRGLKADIATTWAVAIAMHATAGYDIVVMDQGLPNPSRAREPQRGGTADRADAALLVFARSATNDLRARVRGGAAAAIPKPVAMDELVEVVHGFVTSID